MLYTNLTFSATVTSNCYSGLIVKHMLRLSFQLDFLHHASALSDLFHAPANIKGHTYQKNSHSSVVNMAQVLMKSQCPCSARGGLQFHSLLNGLYHFSVYPQIKSGQMNLLRTFQSFPWCNMSSPIQLFIFKFIM